MNIDMTDETRRVAKAIWLARFAHFGEKPKPFVEDERWELCVTYAKAAVEVIESTRPL